MSEQQPPKTPSLDTLNRSVPVPHRGRWWARFAAFLGPGYLVSVGYMDPGNWATDIAGGARFGYQLIFVILLSNFMAIMLQALAARLGIASGLDLAQACRARYRPWFNYCLWIACELAIIACDLAEVIGTAIGLNLLFGIPLVVGTLITILDTTLVLLLMRIGMRALEAFVISLLLIIFACFSVQMIVAKPVISEIMHGFLPPWHLIADHNALYLAIGIIGATVMPHNLYLHSSIVQTRNFEQSIAGKRHALRWAVTDSTFALLFALLINASILILAAAVFHAQGRYDVEEISQAYHLLKPMLGVGFASVLFAVALLVSGLNSTVTATLAGQIVMEGFLNLKLKPWQRRLLTRSLAIIPVFIITYYYGEQGSAELLVFSQVVLSMQLPFAIIPLLRCVADRRMMGELVAPRWMLSLAWIITLIIVILNAILIIDTFS